MDFKFILIQDKVDNIKKRLFTLSVDLVGSIFLMKDSIALWNFSNNWGINGSEYLKQNGRLIQKIDDIQNIEVRDFIRKKILQQMEKSESKGFLFHSDSSLAKKISKSITFKNFIRENKHKFQPNKAIKNSSLNFETNPDLFNALHRADIIDIKIKEDGTFCAKIVDTYDFNKKDKCVFVKTVRHYQDNCKITTYYTITQIEIPESVWRKY